MLEIVNLIKGMAELAYVELFATPVGGIPRLVPATGLLIRCVSASLLPEHPGGMEIITADSIVTSYGDPQIWNSFLDAVHGIFDRAKVAPGEKIASRREAEEAAAELYAFSKGIMLPCLGTAQLAIKLPSRPYVMIARNYFNQSLVDKVTKCKPSHSFPAKETRLIEELEMQLTLADDLLAKGDISGANALAESAFKLHVAQLCAALGIEPSGEKSSSADK
jgi:hypothetical protein